MFDLVRDGIQFIKSQILAMISADSPFYIPLQATTSSADNAERCDLQEEVRKFLNLTTHTERRNEATTEIRSATDSVASVTASATTSTTSTTPTASTQSSPPQDSINYRLFTTEPNMIRFQADQIFAQARYRQKMFSLIESSKHDARYAIGAANAITALNLAEVSFSGMNFNNVKIAHAYLPNAMMDHTDLSNADLTDVNLKHASLVQANLSTATLKDIDFEEQAYIEAGDEVSIIQISADGTLVAMACGKKIKLWNRQTSQFSHTLQGHTGDVTCIRFSPDGNSIVSGSNDRSIRLWDISTGQIIGAPLIRNIATQFAQSDMRSYSSIFIAISPDAREAVTLEGDGYRFWDINTHSDRHEIVTGEWMDKRTRLLTYSSDGNILAAAGRMGLLNIYATSSGKDLPVHRFERNDHTQDISCFTFSHDNKSLISASNDKSLRIWAVDTGEMKHIIPEAHHKTITGIAVSPDGNVFASGGEDHRICLW